MKLAVYLLFALPAAAHMMSMSNGDLQISGDRAEYTLRMPLYEITHIKEPEKMLLQNFRLFDGKSEAPMVKHLCEANPGQDIYVCRAEYQFPAPVKDLEVQCTFAAVTVPNHIHLLRAARDGAWENAVFDSTYTRMPIQFVPSGRAATVFSQAWSGVRRASGGWAQLLFLLALAMAARSRRELFLLFASFAAGEWISTLWIVYGTWSPAPRFVEAAAALTVAYLCVEILLLPEAGHRWAVAGVLGVFHGLYFGLFLRESQMHWLPVLTGVIVTELGLLGAFSWLLSRVEKLRLGIRPVRAAAGVLLVVGMTWFFLGLRN